MIQANASKQGSRDSWTEILGTKWAALDYDMTLLARRYLILYKERIAILDKTSNIIKCTTQIFYIAAQILSTQFINLF